MKPITKQATNIIERHGFKVVRIEHSKHLHIHTEPEFMFICSKSPSDSRWLMNFSENVRHAARKLGLPPPRCPHVKCREMICVYEGDTVDIMRCDFCNNSLFASPGHKGKTSPARWLIKSVPEKP